MSANYSQLTEQMLQAFQSQQLESAHKYANMILRLYSKDLIALQVQGLCLAMQGRDVEAVTPLYKASKLDQNNPELLSNLAKAQHSAMMHSEAIQTYKKLNRLLPNNAQILTDMGTTFAKMGHQDDAKKSFTLALSIDSNYFLAWQNLGNLQSKLGYFKEAKHSLEKSLELNSADKNAWNSYGNVLFDLGYKEDALLAQRKALDIDCGFAEAWLDYGCILYELSNPSSIDAFKTAYNLNPELPFLLGQLFSTYASCCDWVESESLIPSIINKSDLGLKAIHPFTLLQINTKLESQFSCARTYVMDRLGSINRQVYESRLATPKEKKIKLGYFSSDFKDHPVGITIENIIALHNRAEFEIYGFFLNQGALDDQGKKLWNIFDKSFDLSKLNDIEAIDLIRSECLDIAIDLNGHTSGARLTIFLRNIAQIQISYLGYAATTGTNFYDALIADRVAIPPEHQMHYSEPIAYLPHSFFPVDTSISIESLGNMPSRGSEGLPETGFIFACFNNAYKIKPAIFDIWMDLLKQVPGSVLWLSKPNTTAIKNLQIEAKNRGVDASRLIFADRKVGRSEHLSRLRLADLFLDTPNYNAHATAADALWAGVPVLTLIGHTFAGRVAASQLSALGLIDLITHSDVEYLAKALELATHPDALRSIRTQLTESRAYSPLFNTRQYVKDLESLYVSLLDGINQH